MNKTVNETFRNEAFGAGRQEAKQAEKHSRILSESYGEGLKIVGKPVPKKDAMQLVTGKPLFTQDLAPKDCLVVRLKRSPHANAMIRSIDKTAAMKVPGVEAIRKQLVVFGILLERPPSLSRLVVPVAYRTAPAVRNSRPLNRVWFIAWKRPPVRPRALPRPIAVIT